jgi:hypothetical protein
MNRKATGNDMTRALATVHLGMSVSKQKRMHGLGGYTSYRNGNRNRDYLKTQAIAGAGLYGQGTLHRFVARERPIRKPPQQRIPKPISLSDALEQLNAL